MITVHEYGKFHFCWCNFYFVYAAEYWTSVRTMNQLVSCSAEEALKREKEEADTVTALASLSMRQVEQPGGTETE